MALAQAMTTEEAVKSIETGIDIFDSELKNGIDVIGTGEMGIANTTASAAVAAVFTRRKPEELTGRGTGIDDVKLKNKIKVIKDALLVHRPNPDDAIDVLTKVGGFEIGGWQE